MQSIIGEIIGAEVEAQKITGDAVKKRASLNDDVKAQALVIREKRMAEAKHEIEEKLARQSAELGEKVKSAEAQYSAKAAEIEEAYKKNKKNWADIAFTKVIGK